jgi:hypothetical protein
MEASKNERTAVFSPKAGVTELQEIVAMLAEENGLKPDSRKLHKPEVVKTLLTLAVKVQQITELLREEQLSEATERYLELRDIGPALANLTVPIPLLNLINTVIEAKVYERLSAEEQISTRLLNPQKTVHALDYHIASSTNGNLVDAYKIKNAIAYPADIQRTIQDLIPHFSRITEDISRIEFMIRYAYCFLAPKNGLGEKDVIDDLEATLEMDKDWTNLHTSVEILGEAVKSEIHQRRWKSPLAERMKKIAAIFNQ